MASLWPKKEECGVQTKYISFPLNWGRNCKRGKRRGFWAMAQSGCEMSGGNEARNQANKCFIKCFQHTKYLSATEREKSRAPTILKPLK